MSYGDDFATVDTAGAPLDPIIMIGADPFFWGAVVLALLVAALIGWLVGNGSRSRRDDAAKAIWTAIDDVARAAMKADTEALPARASDLHRVLRARLGRTLDFGRDLTGRVDALHLALEGEREVRDGHAAHDHPPEEETPVADRTAAAPSSSAAANVTIVSIHPSAAARPALSSPRPGRRPLTTRERNQALRLAVADFNDYWRHRSAREAEMRAVVAELCDPGPPPPRAGHGGGHH